MLRKCEDGSYLFQDDSFRYGLIGTILHNIASLYMRMGAYIMAVQIWDETVLTWRDANPDLGIYQENVAVSKKVMMPLVYFLCYGILCCKKVLQTKQRWTMALIG